MAEQPKELAPDAIEWVEEPEIEAAVEKAEEGIVPQNYEDDRPGSEHEDKGWRAARLSKP